MRFITVDFKKLHVCTLHSLQRLSLTEASIGMRDVIRNDAKSDVKIPPT